MPEMNGEECVSVMMYMPEKRVHAKVKKLNIKNNELRERGYPRRTIHDEYIELIEWALKNKPKSV